MRKDTGKKKRKSEEAQEAKTPKTMAQKVVDDTLACLLSNFERESVLISSMNLPEPAKTQMIQEVRCVRWRVEAALALPPL